MAAVMNGMALHGGFIPYGGTFLIFSDYCRPAIRLSALMKQQVIYVMTHDSIGLGEDGPTHQPVEQLASLRAIPACTCSVRRMRRKRPNAGRWRWQKDGPSLLALSRQNLPPVRTEHTRGEHMCPRGYVLAEAEGCSRHTDCHRLRSVYRAGS